MSDQWLVQEFTPFGIHSHLQNWMLVFAGIVLVTFLMVWLQQRRW
jgi:hypothetical protein